MVKKILIAVEEFELAQKTVTKAIELTKQLGAELRILNVINSDILLTRESSMMLSELTQSIKMKSEELVEKLKENFDLENINIVLREGTIVDTIIKEAESWEANILIVGSHARKGINKWISGSIAEQILVKSKIPVLVINKNIKTGKYPPKCK